MGWAGRAKPDIHAQVNKKIVNWWAEGLGPVGLAGSVAPAGPVGGGQGARDYLMEKEMDSNIVQSRSGGGLTVTIAIKDGEQFTKKT